MISQDFIAQCLLQLTEQGAIDWFIDNENGGYFAVFDSWSIRFKGDGHYGHLTYRKGLKFGEIIASRPQGFFKKEETQMHQIMRNLLIQIREKIYPENKDTITILEEQDQKIRKEFCASMLGWNK